MRAFFTAMTLIRYASMTMYFKQASGFAKDFKRLAKKYRSLPDDLLIFEKIIAAVPLGTGRHFAVLHAQKSVRIVKARLFCRCLKGSSLRVIYAYCESENFIEFIELYYKGNKQNEDRERIKDYLKNFVRRASFAGTKFGGGGKAMAGKNSLPASRQAFPQPPFYPS